TAQITEVKLAASADNPTYLNNSHDNRFLYSVMKSGENGGVASFSVNEQTGDLTLLNSQVSAGSPPCHVSVDRHNQFVLSANYHKGTVESYLINQEDGTVTPPVSIIHHEGHGPDPRQEKPHTHFAGVTPNEKYLAVVELGADQLITYKISNNGKLIEVNRLAIYPGSGPRHLAFHPNEKFAYMMTEFSSEVIALTFNPEDGSFTEIQTISTIPDNFKENNQGSAIHISADGRFVYAGNRGHNSIAVFQVNIETGILQFVEHVSSEGNWPRDFVIDPTDKFIVASNQESNNLVLFARDITTGKLTLLQSDITVPEPVCVKFLHY
ncbi:MAG TPA: lactonase family protein, partial [Bacillales bacterium]|nr:lactonase family protein [Bacillales bacterium]